MIESGSIIELSNNKKYIITDHIIYEGFLYYISLEVDYDSLIPTDNTIFFKALSSKELLPISIEGEIEIIKEVFINKFISEFMEEKNE